MFSFFFKKNKEKRYEREKLVAQVGSDKQRLSLAKNTKTNQEILFFLAQHDPSALVRKEVAINKKTPVHASKVLSVDASEDVRMALAKRLVTLLPDVSQDKQSRLYAYTVQALGNLALDEVIKIRRALTSTLKDHALAPPAIAFQLAKDIEKEVSEPVLRLCTVISDKDLADILASHPAPWAAEAVARRSKISAFLSLAVIKKGQAKAGQLLLRNKGAEIDDTVLHEVIARAQEFPEWHEPLVANHRLPSKMALRLARLVDASIRKTLMEKGEYDEATVEEMSEIVTRRVKMQSDTAASPADSENTIKQKVRELHSKNELTEATLADHLAMKDDQFIVIALAYMINAKITNTQNIFKLKKPKLICSVCWRAGLSMRFALRLQQEVAQIKKKELLYPKNGTDYPLTDEEMIWQLEFIGL